MKISRYLIVLTAALLLTVTGCKDDEQSSGNASAGSTAGPLPSGGGSSIPPAGVGNKPGLPELGGSNNGAGELGSSGSADAGAIGQDSAQKAAARVPTPPSSAGGATIGELDDNDLDVGGGMSDADFDVGVALPGIGLPGSDVGGVFGGATSGDGGADSTGAGVAGLDAELDVSLGQFDGIVLAGQTGARGMEQASAGSTSSSSSSGSGASGSGSSGKSGASGASGAAGSAGGAQAGAQSRIPAPPGESQSSSGGESAAGESSKGSNRSSGQTQSQKRTANTPEDISDGDDDDLVARQLREAAENEEDPELREKLWDEYRKYKDGSR